MSELTPERIREAAKVHDQVHNLLSTEGIRGLNGQDLRRYADRLERERAERTEGLAKWLSIHIGKWPEDEWELRSRPNYWHDRADELIKAYPTILDGESK